jgi:hypothetical protein
MGRLRPAERKEGKPVSITVSGCMLPAFTACLRSTTNARPGFPPHEVAF